MSEYYSLFKPQNFVEYCSVVEVSNFRVGGYHSTLKRSNFNRILFGLESLKYTNIRTFKNALIF